MVGFLRPQTLFGTKFESYLNEVEVVKKGRLDWIDELEQKIESGEVEFNDPFGIF